MHLKGPEWFRLVPVAMPRSAHHRELRGADLRLNGLSKPAKPPFLGLLGNKRICFWELFSGLFLESHSFFQWPYHRPYMDFISERWPCRL